MPRLYLGTLLVYALFQLVANASGSGLGEWGVPIALVIVTATALAASLLPLRHQGRALDRVRALGLGRPAAIAMGATVALGAAMLAFYPVVAAATGAELELRARWWTYLPGLFAQGGIAEEVLFRGYLFGQLRQERSFWRAALASMPPFAVAHLALFVTMEPPLALAALLLSISTAFPLARLYDLGSRTIWAPALLHFVIQAAPKLVVAPGMELQLGVGWMAVAMVLPWIALALRGQASGDQHD